jgi:TetR/AcrR family transcriptional repressor of nem operon
MRVSREVMARHHREIVATASRMLRQRGIEGLSVADLMQAAGLTHGGFYRHFASKDALVAEATAAAFSGIRERLAEWTSSKGSKAALDEYVAEYLSQRHVEAPGTGCPIAAYGAEVARESDVVRAAFNEGVEPLVAWIADGLAGPAPRRRARAIELLTMMVGAIVTARAAGSGAIAGEVLACARKRAAELTRTKA